MFGIWSSYWNTATIVLAAVIVLLSLAPSRHRHRTAVTCYTLIAAGSAAMAAFPMFFGINMASAFGPRSVSPTAYLLPLFTVVIILLPALAMYPWISLARGRLLVLLLLGTIILLSLGQAVVLAVRWHGYADAGYAFRATLYLLPWLRVDDMRTAIHREHPA